MPNDDLLTRARDLVDALTALLPQIQFEVYVQETAPADRTDLYIVGFITQEVLIGGYEIPAEYVPHDFTHHVLNLSQFFRKAWSDEVSRFYPQVLQATYARVKNGGSGLPSRGIRGYAAWGGAQVNTKSPLPLQGELR
jgi:hypothetical protein